MDFEFNHKEHISLSDLNIVLDLDSTLIHSYNDIKKLEELLKNINNNKKLSRIFSFKIEEGDKKERIWSIKRPYLDEFLVFAFSYFKSVNIWSAGDTTYVLEAVKRIFKGLPQPNIIFTRDDVILEDDFLSKPLDRFFSYSSFFSEYANEKNTLFLDDNDSNFFFNQNNGILIPKFEPNKNEKPIKFLEREDNCLLQLKYWLSLDHVRLCQDVRKLEKKDIFLKSPNRYYKEVSKQKYFHF